MLSRVMIAVWDWLFEAFCRHNWRPVHTPPSQPPRRICIHCGRMERTPTRTRRIAD